MKDMTGLSLSALSVEPFNLLFFLLVCLIFNFVCLLACYACLFVCLSETLNLFFEKSDFLESICQCHAHLVFFFNSIFLLNFFFVFLDCSLCSSTWHFSSKFLQNSFWNFSVELFFKFQLKNINYLYNSNNKALIGVNGF